MNLWHDLKSGSKDKLSVVIEIPKLSRIKYELDKESGLIKVDRVLYSPMHYPANYGFVPKTLWDDGDPLDVLVLSHEPFVPGSLIDARPIGVLDMTDDGEGDAKILAVPSRDPRFNGMKNISDIEPHILEEIQHFFRVYGLQNGAWVLVQDVMNADKTNNFIQVSVDTFGIYKVFYYKGDAVTDLRKAIVYPNPYRPNDNNPNTGDENSGIIFTNIPSGSKVSIFTIAGEKVNDLESTVNRVVWDGKNASKVNVASGIYVYVIKTKDGQYITGKLSIIR